ncbi:CGNR zinc finger domain-containing protein [Streptomyces roseifaciens]|uniref:CGNR zinc finger domain-containing protein n=1 Tax=Streptomyces roseifaciens TaxID=1488406 RepID=UPI0007C772F5|nr:CGNR zinc finger domain-containing protein [Streptomyces roseifaciens]
MAVEQVQDRQVPERWVWYGGRLSVDFVNTLRDRFKGGRELLVGPGDLAEWFAEAGVTPQDVAVDDALLREARELREAIDAGYRASVAGEPFPEAAAGTINVWLARLGEHPSRLDVQDGAAVFRTDTAPSDARRALCRIAVDAATLLGSGDTRTRLRICDGHNCSGRFVDKSVGKRRRWCSMAICGNRAKAAQHRRAARAH